jgi:MFS family permease
MINNNNLAFRIACILIAGISILVVGVQPIFIGLVTEQWALSLGQQSAVMSAELCGALVGTLLSMRLALRFGVRRSCLVAALGLLLVNLMTASGGQFDTLLLLRFAAGMGSGLLYAHAVYCLGRISGQGRSYGMLLFFQTAIFSCVAACLPIVAEQWGFAWAIYFIAAWFVVVCVACAYLPAQHDSGGEFERVRPFTGVPLIGRFALIGMLCLQLSVYSIWGFIDGIGGDAGISPVNVGWAVSLGLLGGLPGAAVACVVGGRFGQVPMIAAGSLMVLLSIVLLASPLRNAVDLAFSVFLMNFGWLLALSYYMALVVSHDANGSLTKLISLVQVASAAAAPTLLAMVLQGSGKAPLFVASSVAIILGGVLMVALVGLNRVRIRRTLPDLSR